MPYPPQEIRDKLNPSLETLISALHSLTDDQLDGGVEYVLVCLMVALWIPRYRNFVRVVGNLVLAVLEYYRRVGVPYEDSKIAEHGDIF
jgi:hypothetical protein